MTRALPDPVHGELLITPSSVARIARDNRPRAASPEKSRDRAQQISEQDEQVSQSSAAGVGIVSGKEGRSCPTSCGISPVALANLVLQRTNRLTPLRR